MINVTMAKASRLVIDELNRMGRESDVQGFNTPAHIYICDYMTAKYNHRAIMNVIKSHLNNMPKVKRQYKHFTPTYWYKIVDNILGDNAKIIDGNVNLCGEMVDYNPFIQITQHYLLSDYGQYDAIKINNIVNTASIQDIISACKVATQNSVYSVPYIESIINSEHQKKHLNEVRESILFDKTQQSNKLLNTETLTHTPIELAQMEYNYEKRKEDILLELLVEKLLNSKEETNNA